MKALGKRNVQDMFRHMDADGNGMIDREEFQQGLAAHGMDAAHIAALFRQLDPHRTGSIDYKTFFDTYYDQLPLPPALLSNAQVLEKVQHILQSKRHRLHKLFHSIDADKNGEFMCSVPAPRVVIDGVVLLPGTIDHREFHQCLTSLGLHPSEINVVLDVFDPDGNGAIDYAEFSAAVLPLDGATELHALHLAMDKPHGVKAFPPPPSLVKPLMEQTQCDGLDGAADDVGVAELYATFVEKLLLKHRDLRSAFRVFDVKKEGQLPRDAFARCIESVFGDGAADATRRLWPFLDPTNSGFVPFYTFSKGKQHASAQASPIRPRYNGTMIWANMQSLTCLAI
ncbi:hypothetical protein DYB32_008748 [Aphanomyces invadans]|uniref:EF-hand domain-containing protein n=1 Tax=Aphanomyces invadans TaxID=157072 RepID=A0A418AKF9_9STRA|nr:hypothetical protein DYB32_008748 [Aphanomyces invadans]